MQIHGVIVIVMNEERITKNEERNDGTTERRNKERSTVYGLPSTVAITLFVVLGS